MRKRIAIIGHFGGDQDFQDGQTVKTKILYDELIKNTEWDIQKIDTYWKSKEPIKLLLSTLKALILRKDIIVLLSINGMKILFPILSFFSRWWKVRIFHDVIGGNLDKYTMKYPKFQKYLNSFAVNWVETETLKKGLNKCDVMNCEVIPNFKRLTIISEADMPDEFYEPYHFCTFSRVMKEKGIEEAIHAVEEINKEKGRNVCCLDIYGVADKSYKEEFEQILAKSTSVIKYCGLVPYNKSVSVIKEYYALLFPTYWDGEGFPGTIVDAFSAGLPVISSDWNSNKEIINHRVNGLLYPDEDINTLKDGILQLVDNSHEIFEMKRQCITDARRYQPEEYISKIIGSIEGTSKNGAHCKMQ